MLVLGLRLQISRISQVCWRRLGLQWSTLITDEKTAATNARNKAFADAHKAKPQSDPSLELGPIDESARKTFKMLDERVAALKLQVEALIKGFPRMQDGAGKPGDS